MAVMIFKNAELYGADYNYVQHDTNNTAQQLLLLSIPQELQSNHRTEIVEFSTVWHEENNIYE